MNNYFCVLPFFGYEFHTGRGTHCCLLPKNYDIDKIRTDILNQKRSPYCNACWKLEDAGLISDRKLKNSALDFYYNKDINYIEQDVKQGKFKTIMVKNVTSNICNATCVTCNSTASSAWATLEKKINIKPVPRRSQSKEKIGKNLNFKDLVILNFIGGEPLLEKLNFYILEKLLEHGNTNCYISITTNGSVDIDQDKKELLKKFKNLNFNISIDGVGPVFEYLRFPLKWDKLLDNLKFFKTITDNVSVSYTTSNLNVVYHEETVEWFKKQNLNYSYNPVINPSYFQPNALPKIVKQKILQKYSRTKDLNFFIGKEHLDSDDDNFKKMLAIITQQDLVKGISINDYLPELIEIINDFRKY